MPKFDYGNKAAEKWTESDVYDLFIEMRGIAETDDQVLCLQDVIKHPKIGLYTSGLNYLLEKFPVFEKYKKDIQDVIVSKINLGALTGKYVSTPSIWRMKQLGERDEAHIDHTTAGEKIAPQITAQSPEQQKKINDLLSDFDDE